MSVGSSVLAENDYGHWSQGNFFGIVKNDSNNCLLKITLSTDHKQNISKNLNFQQKSPHW